MAKYIFSHVDAGHSSREFPTDLEVRVEFDGDCTIEQIVEAFKLFLCGCSFSPSLVEKIAYED